MDCLGASRGRYVYTKMLKIIDRRVFLSVAAFVQLLVRAVTLP